MSSAKNIHHYSWYQPIFSSEHGVYIVLIVSFLVGVELASHWSWATTVALITAFAAFEAEYSLTLQIKQRRSLKPRFLFWGSIYSLIALLGGIYLAFIFPPLIAIYAIALSALIVDTIAVYQRKQKARWNEFITFASVCLTTPLAFGATNGSFIPQVWGLWLLNTFFFASAIFTVKLRKPPTASLLPSLIYHSVAVIIIICLWNSGFLSLFSALGFTVVIVKFAVIATFLSWYQNTKIQNVAMLETLSAIAFLGWMTFSLLPERLPTLY